MFVLICVYVNKELIMKTLIITAILTVAAHALVGSLLETNYVKTLKENKNKIEYSIVSAS